MAQTSPITPTLPADEIRLLEDQITELAAHIHAANYRLLMLIHRFDGIGCLDRPRFNDPAHTG